ncbi:hypothetical protein PSCICJ_21760 [Pseudomonas cichorii]|nr:hypothetical protein PSCICJ_21760 [Pseudomonas cichorii]
MLIRNKAKNADGRAMAGGGERYFKKPMTQSAMAWSPTDQYNHQRVSVSAEPDRT